jgi:hypothetical protein
MSRWEAIGRVCGWLTEGTGLGLSGLAYLPSSSASQSISAPSRPLASSFLDSMEDAEEAHDVVTPVASVRGEGERREGDLSSRGGERVKAGRRGGGGGREDKGEEGGDEGSAVSSVSRRRLMELLMGSMLINSQALQQQRGKRGRSYGGAQGGWERGEIEKWRRLRCRTWMPRRAWRGAGRAGRSTRKSRIASCAAATAPIAPLWQQSHAPQLLSWRRKD